MPRRSSCWSGVQRNPRKPATALLARETADGLDYAGGAMITLSERERERFWRASEELTITKPPLPMGKRPGVQWVRPELRLRVKYLKGADKLRHATLVGLEA